MEGHGGKKASKQNKRSFERGLSTSPATLRCQLRLSLICCSVFPSVYKEQSSSRMGSSPELLGLGPQQETEALVWSVTIKCSWRHELTIPEHTNTLNFQHPKEQSHRCALHTIPVLLLPALLSCGIGAHSLAHHSCHGLEPSTEAGYQHVGAPRGRVPTLGAR